MQLTGIHIKDSFRTYFGAWIVFGSLLLVGMILLFAYLSTDVFVIKNAGRELVFLKANNPVERWSGLSWRSEESLADVDGMIFLFGSERERTFWMRGMKFNLDVVWLKDGKVMKIDSNVQAPVSGEEIARMTSAPFDVDAVIELPAGGADRLGIRRGHTYKELVDR